MPNATCSIEGCEKPSHSRGWCHMHYQRWRKTGSPHRLCESCGTEMPPERGLRKYCSDDCKPRCKVDGCEVAARSKDGYCARHKALVRRNGVPAGTHEWTPASDKYTCVVCGDKFTSGNGSRKYCSVNCKTLGVTYKDQVPSLSFNCVMCGKHVGRHRKASLYQRSDKKICDQCKSHRRKRHKSSPGFLARRDGTKCGICGQEVDLSLAYPDLMRGSVDHILPVALGGTHEDTNLQLAHLRCNMTKQARANFTLA